MTIRDGLALGVADRGLAVRNADLSAGLQTCVRDLLSQRATSLGMTE